MNHSFVSGALDKSKCNQCKRNLDDHTSLAKCEACTFVGKCDVLGNMLLCPTCMAKEYHVAISQSEEQQKNNEFVEMNQGETLIAHSRNVDAALLIREDFFNAETVSIVELREACGSDSAKLFDLIKERQVAFQRKLIEVKESELNLNSRLRAQQQYLHDLVKNLTDVERAQRKVEDIKYQPVVKEVKAPKVKVTAQEKMAQNLMNSKWIKVATQLMEDEKLDMETAKTVALARGLVMSIETARAEIAKILG